jgi:Domain of unknown function (DUF2382)
VGAYGYDHAGMTTSKHHACGSAYRRGRADEGYEWRRVDTGAVTRAEEELRVAQGRTERRETGKVRLRKYVVTEHVKMDVPVTREAVRVTREPVSDTERRPVPRSARAGGRVRLARPSRRSRTRSGRSSPRRRSPRSGSAWRSRPSPTRRRSRTTYARSRSTSKATRRRDGNVHQCVEVIGGVPHGERAI